MVNIGSDYEFPVGEALLAPAPGGGAGPLAGLTAGRQAVLTDSGRSALRLALRALKLEAGTPVLVPVYICDSVVAAVEAEGLRPRFYPMNPDFSVPVDRLPPLARADVGAALCVGYFGFAPDRGLASFCRERAIPVILDLTHSLLSEAAMPGPDEGGCLVVASLRKLLSVPDGGLVTAAGRRLPQVDRDDIAPHAEARHVAMLWKTMALAQRADDAERPFRAGYVAAEVMLDSDPTIYRISATAQFLLENLDAGAIIRRRRANYYALLGRAVAWRGRAKPLFPELPTGICPLGFPILLPAEEARDSLRRYLVARGIFPPIHWPMASERLGMFGAADLQARIMTIPCDQRYTPADMAVAGDLISEWSERDGG